MKSNQMIEAVKTIAEAIANKEFRSRPNYVRPPFIFWGPKGSGKTYSVKQAANILFIPAINIRLGQEMAEDMSYPEITEENNEKYLSKIVAEMFPRYKRDEQGKKIPRRKIVDGEIVEIKGEYQINFEKIKEYIENYDFLVNYYESIGLSINDAPSAIVFLDEVNRIEDKAMFQMIFQLFDSGKFKGYTIPEEISLFAAANPNDGYIVSDWFADPAFTNRCIHLRTTYDFDTWASFATKPDSGYDKLTIEFYKTYPKALFNEDENNFEIPKVSSSFRQPAFLSLYVNGVEYPDDQIREEVLAAVIGETFVANFHLVEDDLATKAPSIESILKEYDEYEVGDEPLTEVVIGKGRDGNDIKTYQINTLKDALDVQKVVSPVRKQILDAVENGKTDLINEVCQNLVEHFHNNINEESFKQEIQQQKMKFIRFMFDLPRGKFGTTFQELVSNSSKDTSSLIAEQLTEGQNGMYLVQLIKYNDKRVVEQ